MTTAKKTAAIFAAAAVTLAGCGGGSYDAYQSDPFAGYDCEKMFAAMDHKIGEANLLFTNHENEDSGGKIGTGVAAGAAGAALASSLILTPVGWVLAGGLMIAGASDIIDGLDHDDLLSDGEKQKLRVYKQEYDEMRERAIAMQCDYAAVPLWDVSPQAAALRQRQQ